MHDTLIDDERLSASASTQSLTSQPSLAQQARAPMEVRMHSGIPTITRCEAIGGGEAELAELTWKNSVLFPHNICPLMSFEFEIQIALHDETFRA